jgi:hypothetical protein
MGFGDRLFEHDKRHIIRSFHGCDYKDYSRLEYDTLYVSEEPAASIFMVEDTLKIVGVGSSRHKIGTHELI